MFLMSSIVGAMYGMGLFGTQLTPLQALPRRGFVPSSSKYQDSLVLSESGFMYVQLDFLVGISLFFDGVLVR